MTSFSSVVITILIYSVVLLVIGYLVYRLTQSNSYISTGTSATGQCNSPDCQGKTQDCGITSSKTITQCSVDSDCQSCYGNMSCQKVETDIYLNGVTAGLCVDPSDPNNPNLGWDNDLKKCVYKCQQGTPDLYLNLSEDQCTGQYLTWEEDGGKCKVSCQNSDPGLFLDVQEYQCLAPLVYDSNKKQCYLPKSAQSYCLPTNIPSIQCNSYTGIKVLAKPTLTSPYNWTCLCRDNTKFTNHGTVTGDCTGIQICDMQGQTNQEMNSNLHIPPNSKTFLARAGTEGSNTPDYWDGETSNWNPFTQGNCVCGYNQIVNQQTKTCSPSLCSPCVQDPSDPNKCVCDPDSGYLDCYSTLGEVIDPIFGSYVSGICAPGTSIPDPCAAYEGDIANKFDHNTSTCKCDTANGYTVYQTDQVPTGQKCANLCQISNPCGNRGDCYVITDDSRDQQSLWQFNIMSGCDTDHPDNCAWLLTNQDPRLSATPYLMMAQDGSPQLSEAGSQFVVEPYCQPGTPCVSVVTELTNNYKYYLKEKASGSYLYYDQSAGTIKFVSANQQKDNVSIWIFAVTNDQAAGDKHLTVGRIYFGGTSYLGVDQQTDGSLRQPLSVTNTILFQGTARCKNCRVPYTQNHPDLYCNRLCLKDGETCSGYCGSDGGTAPCCSMYCRHNNAIERWGGAPDQSCSGGSDGDLSEDAYQYGC